MRFRTTFTILALSLVMCVCANKIRREESEGSSENVNTDDSVINKLNNVKNKNNSVSEKTTSGAETTRVPSTVESKNKTGANITEEKKGMIGKIMENKEMLMRTVYVLLGVSSIVIVYFIVRAWRTRRRGKRSRKYGLITNSGDLEMEPLDQEVDDDDEMTMFERRK